MSVEIERSDWIRSPGRTVHVQIGPFGITADSADGGSGGIDVTTRWCSIVLSFEHRFARANRPQPDVTS